MKVMLDTHCFLWAVDRPGNLCPPVRELLEDKNNDLLLSTASVWEIAIKVGLNKLTLSLPFLEWIERASRDLEIKPVAITLRHADAVTRLPWHHRDPFDRLLVAQAMVEGVPLLSADLMFDRYEVARIWD